MRSYIAALVLGAVAAEFVPANDPRVWYGGRNRVNADGSRSFDWEGSQVFLNVAGSSSPVIASLSSASSGGTARLVVSVSPVGIPRNWTVYDTIWVAPGAPSNVTVAAGLPAGNWTVRLFNDLEPSSEHTQGNMGIDFAGFFVNGKWEGRERVRRGSGEGREGRGPGAGSRTVGCAGCCGRLIDRPASQS